jgi:putative glutathione S-transferase
MGMLVNGEWKDVWYDTESTGGRFVRRESIFRDWVTADGSSGFPAASGRYHLYVSLACPWAHRTLIYRTLKGLEDHISVSIVHPLMLENGWTFQDGEVVIADTVNRAEFLHQVYSAARPDYTGRVTTPLLWDREGNTIVNNESSEIIRMLNREFDRVGANHLDFCPEELVDEIDRMNDFVYRTVNNGVYRAGFATSQSAYEEAVIELFEALDRLERLLAGQRYLVGDRITEADWRLFPTLLRFDAVYVGHFKCNIRRLVDYPNLWAYTRELYQVPGVADTVNFEHIKLHYYGSHASINPTGVVPRGPQIDFALPHGRD